MIDLHTHTNYSDGTWNVKKLLEEAEKNNIEILSITDHNNVLSHIEIKENNYSKIFNGRIISGVELNTIANKAKVEFLAYNFDVEKMNEWCKKTYKNKLFNEDLDIEFKNMITASKRNGVILDEIKYNKNDGWPIDFIFPEIKKHIENKKLFDDKEWNDIDYFFRCCTCREDFPLYINMEETNPLAKDVISAVHDFGGKVFLAHLYNYPLKDYKQYLDVLVKEKLIDGIEVYHSNFTEEQSKFLIDYCKKNNLLMSGGSDCHGDKKANRKLGIGFGNLNIPKDIVNNWIE